MLTGMHGVWRIRVAKDYRVTYTVNDERLVILVVDAGHAARSTGNTALLSPLVAVGDKLWSATSPISRRPSDRRDTRSQNGCN